MFKQIFDTIQSFDTIIIHRHTKPDGDAMGSQIGLKHIIKETFPQKRVYAVGDEWQSIYAFSGSRIEYIYNSVKKLCFAKMGAEHKVEDGKWLPFNEIEKITLRKIEKPITLIALNKLIDVAYTNIWLGFDMEKKDFVKPFGCGNNIDFEVKVEWLSTDDGTNITASNKTATINFYSLEDIYLVDLPGYGYAKVAKSDKVRWSGLIEGYLHDERNLGLIFQLIDIRHPPTKDDLQMIDFLIESEIPFVIIFTKADKLTKRQREERRSGFAQEIPYYEDIVKVEFSAETGEGADEIRQIIEELAQGAENSG